MRTFQAKDSNEMAVKVYGRLKDYGVSSDSRNGEVIRFEEPVMMEYTDPWQRANFTPYRDANPFFHIAEAMWMLAGRNDVELLTYFNKNMAQYSDDGKSFNAAYGYRLRHHFGHDQLQEVVKILKASPDTRQAVCQIWDSNDLNKETKDKACNISLIFYIVQGKVNLMVYNRSNDAVYGGVTGANPVHFSYFQQWVADSLDLPMGSLYFTSTNLHVYTKLYDHWEKLNPTRFVQPPEPAYLRLGPIEEFEILCNLIEHKEYIEYSFISQHLERIVKPIMNTWILRKEGQSYLEELARCECPAMYHACFQWIHRRIEVESEKSS